VELAQWVIKTLTEPDDRVLDHCFGGGSAGVATVRLGRRFTGVELDPGVFQVGMAKIESEVDHIRQQDCTDRGTVSF